MNFVSKLGVAGLLVAGLCSITATAAPAPVSRGADYVSPPSAPERIFLDARTRPIVQDWRPGDPIREIPRQFHGEEELQRHPPAPANPVVHSDVLIQLQRQHGGGTDGGGFTTPLGNLAAADATGVVPPDPTGDVGGAFYVQVYNGGGGAILRVYNTADGSLAA